MSNGEAKVGSTYSPCEFFDDWKVIDAHGTRGAVALETALRGTCDPAVCWTCWRTSSRTWSGPVDLIKALARSHQYLGVNAAIDNLHRARAEQDKRLGVFWHTQGSGKSLSMLWFTQKVLRQVPGKWTFVMVTDRTELDTQLHGEFADAGAISPEARVHAESVRTSDCWRRPPVRVHADPEVPAAKAGAAMPVLSDRSDVIVITDEAHRSQYDTLALNMRRALPNASMMGFTGTPLIAGEEQATREQFGDYVSVYNFRDAIEDGATVPLYYENRIPELQLVNENFSEELDALLEAAELDEDAEGQLAGRSDAVHAADPSRAAPDHRQGSRRPLRRAGLHRQGDVRRARQGRRRADVRPGAGAWAEHLAELRRSTTRCRLERPWLASRIE